MADQKKFEFDESLGVQDNLYNFVISRYGEELGRVNFPSVVADAMSFMGFYYPEFTGREKRRHVIDMVTRLNKTKETLEEKFLEDVLEGLISLLVDVEKGKKIFNPVTTRACAVGLASCLKICCCAKPSTASSQRRANQQKRAQIGML